MLTFFSSELRVALLLLISQTIMKSPSEVHLLRDVDVLCCFLWVDPVGKKFPWKQ